MSTIHIVMAYQPGDPSREKPARIVREWLESMGCPMVIAGGKPGVPFNVGHAKNFGVQRSEGHDPLDVFVLADADCVCDEVQFRQAVWLAYRDQGLVSMGDAIRILDRDDLSTLDTWQETVATPRGALRVSDATPQLLAIRRDAFDQVGGYDESYIGYGFEDYDFRQRCGERWPHRLVKGHIVHLWHEPDTEKVTPGEIYRANEQRWYASGGIPWNR